MCMSTSTIHEAICQPFTLNRFCNHFSSSCHTIQVISVKRGANLRLFGLRFIYGGYRFSKCAKSVTLSHPKRHHAPKN